MSEGLNFRIIENNSHDDEIIYEQFKKEYIENKVPTAELRNKYHLTTTKKYHNTLNKIFEETGYQRPKGGCLNPLYYCKNGENYCVSKCVEGKTVYYGTYKSTEIAEKIVKELKLVDWDKKQLSKIQDKILGEKR